MHGSSLRRGLAVLAAAGVVFTVAILVRGPMPQPTDPAAFAQWAYGPYTRFAWAAILGGGVLELLGLTALYAAIVRDRPSAAAQAGWVLSMAGMSLAMVLFGFMAMAAPRIAQLYLQGDTRAMEVVTAFFGGTRLSVAVLAAMTVAYIVGCVMTAVAAWRHTAAPRWAAVAFVLHAPLISIPVPFPLEIAGGVLLLLAGIGYLALASSPAPAPVAAQHGGVLAGA